ncbi:MAG: aldo/keto reductase [Oscillospiraceae bacterium]|nr:aldo/keto reductase [Oscillospiraceae bacterium]
MEKIQLGKTGLMASRASFGGLPIQRREMDDAVKILRRAYDNGITLFDTAAHYTDSQEKMGKALSDVRHDIIFATKSHHDTKELVTKSIEDSLRQLKTDYIDIFQFHNPPVLPDPEDQNGIFAAALEAKKKGYVRHIGLSLHPTDLAFKAIESGAFETLQYPFSYLSTEKEQELVRKTTADCNMGYIAMKGMAGGLLTNIRACYAFIKQFKGVVPIWGIRTMQELEEWLAVIEEDPDFDDELLAVIEKDRKELGDSFCRSCGYCMPCPAGIEIRSCARMDRLMRRAPWKEFGSALWREKMDRIKDCTECGQCLPKCPYNIDIPNILKFMLDDYNRYYEEHKNETFVNE